MNKSNIAIVTCPLCNEEEVVILSGNMWNADGSYHSHLEGAPDFKITELKAKLILPRLYLDLLAMNNPWLFD